MTNGKRARARIGAALGVVFASLAVGAQSGVISPAGAATRQATAAPNSQLQNLQVVTVSWSGYTPTATKMNAQGDFLDIVGIIECTANPPGGHYFYYRDCMVNPTPGNNQGGITGGDGNIVGWDVSTIYGVTAPDGTGSYPFQVQSGTLHNNFTVCNPASPTQCDSPSNIQCDNSNPCVAKVVDYPNGLPYKTHSWDTIQPGDYTSLLDASPSVPLNFGAPPLCPGATAGNVSLEGASSASYALQQWAAQLCQGSNPVTVSYAQVGEQVAKTDFLAGNTNIAVAAAAPTAADLAAAPGAPTFAAAPLDAGGVSIAFTMSDANTGIPIKSVRLTPRLVAMLITNSGTLDQFYTLSHTAAFTGVTFMQAMTNDPEFRALNPGFIPPAQVGGTAKNPTYTFLVEEPMLRAERTDDTSILTNWIASDYDAQQFLQGKDPCGALLNTYWTGVSYPTNQFQDLEQGGVGKSYADFYFPIQGTSTVIQHLLYVKPVGFNPSVPPAPVNGNLPRVSAYFAVMDSVSARRSAFNQAALIAANPTQSMLANYVTENAGTCTPKTGLTPTGFVAPDDAGLASAYNYMATQPTVSGVEPAPVAATDPTAYPLAKIDYAFAPTSGLPAATAGLVSSLIKYAVGPGQTGANLATGYPALTAALAAQANAVADKMAQAGVVPPSPTTTTTVPPKPTTSTTLPGTTTTTPAGQGVAFGPPPSSNLSGVGTSPGPTTPTAATVPPAAAKPATGAKSVPAALQAAVAVAAAALVGGTWLLPVTLALGVLFALAGSVVLRWGRRRARPPKAA